MNTKKWWQHLLKLSLVLLIDLILFISALFLDGMSINNSSAIGHGVPVFTILVLPIIVIITIISIVKMIINIIKSLDKDEFIKNPIEKKPKPRKPFKVFFIVLIISIVLTITSFSIEINNFYNDPSHIGFAFPILSFMLAGILILINVVILIISIIRAK